MNLHGPNGFFREFRGSAEDPPVSITVGYEDSKTDNKKLTGNIEIKVVNQYHPDNNVANGRKPNYTLEIIDNAYAGGSLQLVAAGIDTMILNLSKNFGWYDFTVRVKGYQIFEQRYAGHVETGKNSFTDPHMGGVV